MNYWNKLRIGFGLLFVLAAVFMLARRIQGNILGNIPLPGFLLYTGMIMLVFAFIREKRGEHKADERYWHISHKASRMTFLLVVIIAFIVMLIDSFKPILLPYSIFLAFWICGMVMIYVISYSIIEKKT